MRIIIRLVFIICVFSTILQAADSYVTITSGAYMILTSDGDDKSYLVNSESGTGLITVNEGGTLTSWGLEDEALIRFTAEGDGDITLPVTLSSFTANYLSGNAQLQWITQSETNNLGWNIYRGYSDNPEQAEQLNYLIIPGAGTSSIPTSYTYKDENSLIPESTYWYWLESISNSGETHLFNPVSLTVESEEEEETPDLPTVSSLYKNFPNPFNPTTKIRFDIREGETGELTITNVKGQRVSKKSYNAGSYSISWDGSRIGSGIYFYSLKTPSYHKIEKMVMVK